MDEDEFERPRTQDPPTALAEVPIAPSLGCNETGDLQQPINDALAIVDDVVVMDTLTQPLRPASPRLVGATSEKRKVDGVDSIIRPLRPPSPRILGETSEKRKADEIVELGSHQNFTRLDELTHGMTEEEYDATIQSLSLSEEEMLAYRQHRLNRWVHLLYDHIRSNDMSHDEKNALLQSLHPELRDAYIEFEQI